MDARYRLPTVGLVFFSSTKTTTFMRLSHAVLQLVLASMDGWSVTLLIYLGYLSPSSEQKCTPKVEFVLSRRDGIM
jgi:hypothetical protein